MTPIDEELFEASLCIESNEWTKDTLSSLPACKGVFLFANDLGQPIQLLQAASLRRTAQAKLLGSEDESDTPSRKTDISELAKRLYYTCCYNNFQSQLIYTRLAHAVFKSKANDWIQLPSPAFAVLDRTMKLPYFAVSSNPKITPTRNAFGLFPSRKAAGQFCEILNTVFCLCRNPVLVGTGNEMSCPYLQMQTCPGPCVGKLKMETYQAFVGDALATACGQVDMAIQEKTGQMKTAAQSMHYERAKILKDQVDALKTLKGPVFQWTTPLDALAVLHIDKADKIKVEGQRKLVQQYAVWKITSEASHYLGQCPLDNVETIDAFLKENWAIAEAVPYASNQYEHLATLSLFLFRNNVQGFWENRSSGLPDTRAIFEKLTKQFQLTPPEISA